MSEENKEFDGWLLTLQALTALGVMLTAVAIFVAYYGLQSEQELIRKDQTVVLLARVSEKIKEIRGPVKGVFPDMYVPGEQKFLSKEEARNLYNACLTVTPNKDAAPDKNVEKKEENARVFTCDARKKVADLLSYYDHAAWVYNNAAADETVREFLGRELAGDYSYFEEFIKLVKNEKNKYAWQAFSSTVAEIKNEK